ncbi:MAG: hypothetical protein R3E90_16335 [Marinicella sp.]|nr:hypothetical protein [Xanthomonadales bacterium]
MNIKTSPNISIEESLEPFKPYPSDQPQKVKRHWIESILKFFKIQY